MNGTLGQPESVHNLIPQLRQESTADVQVEQVGRKQCYGGGVYLRTEHFHGKHVPRCISAFRHLFVAAHHLVSLVPRMSMMKWHVMLALKDGGQSEGRERLLSGQKGVYRPTGLEIQVWSTSQICKIRGEDKIDAKYMYSCMHVLHTR